MWILILIFLRSVKITYIYKSLIWIIVFMRLQLCMGYSIVCWHVDWFLKFQAIVMKIFDFAEHTGETDHIIYRKHDHLYSGLSLSYIADLSICSFDFCHAFLPGFIVCVHTNSSHFMAYIREYTFSKSTWNLISFTANRAAEKPELMYLR